MAEMGRATKIPVKPKVLLWLMEQSGYRPEEAEEQLGLPNGKMQEWLTERSKPTLTEARRLAALLKRPLAILLLDSPPQAHGAHISFRAPADSLRQKMNPKESASIRETMRLQRLSSWLRRELNETTGLSERAKFSDEPGLVAQRFRRSLGVSSAQQMSWRSDSEAFRSWRSAIENVGIFVFVFALGRESCRGFSIMDPLAPAVGVNSAWSKRARIFTMFHEVGHLVTRSQSACVEAAGGQSHFSRTTDKAERWCERFAAAVLLPRTALETYLGNRFAWDGTEIREIDLVASLSNKFKTSLRATTIRLIELGVASWDLYREIPASSDNKSARGGGGKGRIRLEISEDKFGTSAAHLIARGVDKELISGRQALSHLRISHADLENLRHQG